MAHAKDESHGGSNADDQQRKGVFSKIQHVKDKLDFTKHLGFQSDPDSLGNRVRLEEYRARQAREAEEKEQGLEKKPAGPSDGIAGVAETLAGAVAPKTENTLGVTTEKPAERQEEKGHSDKSVQFDKSPPRSPKSREANLSSGGSDEQKDLGKDSHKGWGQWAAHKLHQVARVAASKDLSDDLLKKEHK
ncbi:hypothetical protein R1sor_011133 [Riccia sorocarpa]|uniref:Uncharacterized protein n=1 Tax=Riccia sorocarpa TaxID=122646 RepID=A0ABD3I2R5_9MARC